MGKQVQNVKLTEEILVWLAIMSPLTRWAEGRYGDFLDRATWMLAGPQGMKLANFRSRILCRLLWTWDGHRSGGGRLSSTLVSSRGGTKGPHLPEWGLPPPG